MNGTNRARRLIPITFAILMPVSITTWLARQHHQLTLNRELIAAIKQSDASRVDSLLAAGADPNTRDTPERHQSVLQSLHDLIDPPPPDFFQTTLLLAITSDTDDNKSLFTRTTGIVKALLAKGANPEATGFVTSYPSKPGYIILRHVRASKTWVTNGVSHKPIDPLATPLIAACIFRQPDTIRLLLDHGAHIEQSGQFGETPLISATVSGNAISVRVLLDHGANPNVGANPNFFAYPAELGSPLTIAQEYGLRDIARLLKSHGAK